MVRGSCFVLSRKYVVVNGYRLFVKAGYLWVVRGLWSVVSGQWFVASGS